MQQYQFAHTSLNADKRAGCGENLRIMAYDRRRSVHLTGELAPEFYGGFS